MNDLKKTVIALVVLLSGCATAGHDARPACPGGSVTMHFIESVPARNSGRTGRFLVANHSSEPIALRLATRDGLQLYAGDAAPFIREADGSWRNYNIQLDELIPPEGVSILDAGQSASFSFDMNGAFLTVNLPANRGRYFTLQFILESGCSLRSEPFQVSTN